MIISFAGHSTVIHQNEVKEAVKKQMISNITNPGEITCYLGGYGDFDKICAYACNELKKIYPGIEVVYVTPYINLSEQAKIKEMQQLNLYDSSIYPPIENVPPRFAILKRNEWMMSCADLIIAYVDHNYGGAYRSLQVAKRKNKKIINICDLT